MVDSALKILTHINLYSISLAVIVSVVLLSFLSSKFKEDVKLPLQICFLLWVVFFGYRVYTGNSLYSVMTKPSQSQIEAARYKKVMIDGREVIVDKATGEVVKKPRN